MSYSIFIKNTKTDSEEIDFWKARGSELVQLRDNEALMVAGDALEEVMNAALDAGNGDFDAFKIALGIENVEEE